MFTQNPHPFYNSLLKSNYIIKPVQNDRYTNWFEWISGDEKLFINKISGTVLIIDKKTKEQVLFPTINFKDNYIQEDNDIFSDIEIFVSIIKKSLDVKYINYMNFIIYEFITNYSYVTDIYFSKVFVDNRHKLRIIDQDGYIYYIETQNVFEIVSKFYIISNLNLDNHIKVSNFSNHELLKSFENSQDLIDMKIEKTKT